MYIYKIICKKTLFFGIFKSLTIRGNHCLKTLGTHRICLKIFLTFLTYLFLFYLSFSCSLSSTLLTSHTSV